MPRIYKSDEDKLRIYRARVADGKKVQKHFEPIAQELIATYRNEVQTEDQFSEDGHRINVAEGIGTIDSLYASLTAVQVSVIVKNKAHGTIMQRRIAEKGVEEVWREARVSRRAARSVKDALLAKIGWVKVGYDFYEEDREVPRGEEEIDEDVQGIFEEANANGLPTPTPEEIAAVVPTHKTEPHVLRDRIVVDHITPWKELLWDPTADHVEDIRWYIQVSLVPVDDVWEDPAFHEYVGGVDEDDDDETVARKRAAGKAKLRKKVQADSKVDVSTRAENRKETEDDLRVTVYEMWDLDAGTICTFTEGADFILNEQPNPFANEPDYEDRSPFVPIIIREDPQNVLGISDMEIIKPSLDQLNVLESRLTTYIEQFNPKILGPEGGLTENGQDALQSKEFGAYVEYEDDHQRTDFDALTPPPMPQEMFFQPDRVRNSIREMTGVSELMRGIFPDRKRTATETAEVVAASSARQSEKRNLLEDFYVAIARRILKLMQIYYTKDRVSRLSDIEGDVVWEWDAESITMEADLEVILAPKEHETLQNRRDKAMWMMANLAPIPEVDKVALMKHVLLELDYDMEIIREVLLDPAEQQAQKQAELQDAANKAAAAQGITPDASAVPGPLSGEDLAAAANAGELPAELDGFVGREEDQLLEMDGMGTESPTGYLAGP